MRTRLLKKARELWPESRRYQRDWARSVARLGDKGLLARYVGRRSDAAV
jgi:hypothetical protein